LNYIKELVNADTSKSILLFQEGDYSIYWLGLDEDSEFRVNVYLIKNKDEALIVDPGNRNFFEYIKKEVEKIMGDYSKVIGAIFHHQDPDVSASIIDWLEIVPDMKIITTPRTNVLLKFYGIKEYEFFDITKQDFIFSNGEILSFIESPFLHFPGAFTTYCHQSKFLFTSDIFAALDIEWSLIVEDFETHKRAMDLFSKDYFACNIATRGYAMKIEDLNIEGILPQHGSIIPKEYVKDSIEYLKNLECGVDLIYPYLKD